MKKVVLFGLIVSVLLSFASVAMAIVEDHEPKPASSPEENKIAYYTTAAGVFPLAVAQDMYYAVKAHNEKTAIQKEQIQVANDKDGEPSIPYRSNRVKM